MQAGRKTAVHAVAQAAFFTHLVGQPRGETTAAQDVVAHQQRQKIRVAARKAGLADQHMGLGRRKGDALLGRCGEGLHFGHRRQRGAFCPRALRQA